MVKLNSLLSDRFKKNKNKTDKVDSLAERSSSGELSSFSGVFNMGEVNERDAKELSELLNAYKEDKKDISVDLKQLTALTQEVKAINNQATILHGERIKKAQDILKQYRDGAFTAWLVNTYGNRQSPYNFLQYFVFYKSLTPVQQNKIVDMPKQAIYTLASREGDIDKKQQLVDSYQGESKKEVLDKIRTIFPLPTKDKRQHNPALDVIKSLDSTIKLCKAKGYSASDNEKKIINALLGELKAKHS
ncbi:MAG: CT583 family protein [Rhabdochlamydiaceae bacterium]|nr:CT583 family protein [Candidatus Amphrikana amoebophyrae]